MYQASAYYLPSALGVTFDAMLNGKKAKTTFPEKTILDILKEKEEENRPLTEEDIKKETMLYFRQKRIEKLNFDLAKIRESKGGTVS